MDTFEDILNRLSGKKKKEDKEEKNPAAQQQGQDFASILNILGSGRRNTSTQLVDSYVADIQNFSQNVGAAWEGMDYQNYQDTIRDYTGQRDAMLQRTDELIGYLNENADLYETESLDGMIQWLEQNKTYLQNVGTGLDQQKGFFESFISEKDYTLYDTYKETSAEELREIAKTQQDWETRDWMEKRAAALEYKAPRSLDVIDGELTTVKEQLKQQEAKDLKALEEWSLWFSTEGASSPYAKAPANGGESEETRALKKRLSELESERQAAVSQERAASAPKLPDTVEELDAEIARVKEEYNVSFANDQRRAADMGVALASKSKKTEELEALQTQLLQKRASILAEDLLKNKYAHVMEVPDFGDKSKYAGMKNILADSDYGYINGDKRAENLYGYTLNNPRQRLLGMDRTWVTRMREDEKKLYNYLYNTAGRSKANEFLSELEPVLLKRQREDEERFARWDAQEHPFWSSVATVVTAPLKPLAFVGQTIDSLDGNIDPNAAYNRNIYTSKAIREEVPKNWGPVGSFAYQTGMSMADFLTTTGVAGGNPTIAMTIMGSGAAADTTLEALDRGLGSGQAYTLGVVAGIAEALTERFSLDALLDKTTLTKSALGYWLKNVLAEGSEEVSSSLINNCADLMISKDKSQWAQSVQAYKDKGFSDSKAFWKAMGDQAASLGLDFLGGAASGGVIGIPGVVMKGAGLVSSTQSQGQPGNTQQVAAQEPSKVVNAPQVAEQNPVIPEQTPAKAEQTTVKTEQQAQTSPQSGETNQVINNREAMQRKLQAAEEAYKTGVISKKELRKIRREAETLNITSTIPETDRVDIDRARAAYEAGEIDEDTYYQIEDAYREQQEQLGTAPAVDEEIQYTENENQELSFAQQQRLAESQKEGATYESEEFEPTLIGNGGLVGGFIRKSVPDGGSQRAAGAGTRGEAGQLSGSAAEQTATANPGRAAIQRRNLAQNLRLDKVSSEELVPGRGTVGKKNTILPAENWDTQMQEVAERVKRETGKEVVYVLGGIEVKTKHGPKTVSGVYDGNQIIIRADHMRLSIEQIADHEMYHALIDANGGRYRMITKLREYILERYDADSFNRIMDKYIAGLTGIVDVTENMSQEAWEDALLRVMEEIFADAYAGINAFGAHAEQLQEIVRPWVEENMLPQATQQSNGTRQTNGPNTDTRYSFAGRNARTADMEALETAKQMEVSGMDTDMIRRETGWFRGKDRKWRFEVDDSSTRVIDQTSNYITLGELLQGAEVLRAYPNIADISVVFQSLEPGVNASYDPQFDSINVSYRLKGKPEDIRAAVLHEIQHVIQRREGFSTGTNVRAWDKKIKAGFDSRKASDIREAQEAENRLKEFQEEDPTFYADMMELDSMEPDLPRGAVNWDTLEQIEEDPPEWKAYDSRRDELKEIYGDKMRDFYSVLRDLQRVRKRPARTAEELYWDTAGEIEARNVAGRRNLTAEQRKKTPPILGGEDTVFADGMGTANSIAETDDGRAVVVVDNDILSSLNIGTWSNAVKEQAKAEAKKAMLAFKDGVRVNGIHYIVNQKSRREFTRSQYTETAYRNSPDVFADKMRAAENVDEIIVATTAWARDGGLKHPRKDNFVDFAHGTVLIQAGANKYKADTVVGITKSGEYVFYDIVDMNPTMFTAKKGLPTNTESNEYSSVVQGSPFESIIYSDKDSVKGNFSGDDTDYRFSVDDMDEEEIAERQTQGTDKIAPTQQELERERQAWLQKEYNDKQKKPENKPVIAKQRLVKGLFDTFSIPTESRDEIKTVIENFADRMQRKGGVQQEDLRDLFDRLYSSGVMTVEADEYNSYARSMIAKGRIYVSDSVKADFGDDWADIRKRAFAAGVYLVNDRSASGIDQWNRTLASDDMLPGLFDPEETDMRAVLERIISVAEAGKDEQMSLPEYTALLAQQEYVSENEILENMERQLETALRIFGENASLEVQLRDQADRRVEREHQKGNERLYKKAYAEEQRRAREKDRRRQMSQQQRERKELSELQQKTLKALQWLHKNQRRAPEELRETWNEVLSDIDILAVGAANAMNWSDKYDASWADLADMYDKARETDPNFMPSDELEKIVTRIRGRKLGDMDIEALQELYRAAVALRTEFYNRNNVINDEEHRLFSEVYADSKAELREAPKTAKRGKVKGSADKLFNLQQLTPMNVIQRLVGWNPNSQFFSLIAKQLEEGERGVRAHTVKANRLLEEFLKENEAWVKKADGQGKKSIWYSLEVPELLELHMGDKPIFGETVTVYFTPLQKVHMYLESKNHENMRHMTGGRTFVDKELYSKGERRQAFANGRTVRLAPETVKKMVADLTAEEKALADLLDSYYNGMAHDEINRTSNVLYGYDKAIGKNYAPICTNEFYTKKELGKLDRTAEGAGHLKERVVSKNPSLMISCLDAFERNVEQTARFVGMAIPARNAKTLMNWRDANTSMTQEISNNGGVQTVDYIQNLITELESGGSFEERDAVSEFGDKLQSQYISSVFGANWGIVVKQLGSIPMAAPYLGFKNFPKPQKVNAELIAKYTQELAWRGMGYATPETKVLKENPNKLQTNKAVQFLFGGGAITWMDSQAAKVLWPWAEKKVAKEFPELQVGDQEMIDAGQSPFYKKVAEEFNNALSRSQSVSDAMHQSTLRKSKNLFTKAFTMFRSDSAQTYNVIRQMLGEASYYKRIKDRRLYGTVLRKLGWAILAMILNALWSAGVDFGKNLLEKKAASYRNDEDELTAGSVVSEMVWDMFSSIAGTFVGGDTIADVVGSVAFDRYSYDTESLAFELYNKVTKLPDEIKGKVDSGEWLGAVKLVVDNAATLFGIPLANVEKTVIGALNWFFPEVGVAWEDLWENPDKASLKGLQGEALQVRVGNLLNDRGIDCADETIDILATLYEAGFTDAVPTAIPESVTVGDEKHKLNKADSKYYESVWNSFVAENLDALVSCDAFIGADQKLQSKMLNRLYEYASAKSKEQLFGNYQLEDSKKKIDELLAAGLTMADSISWAAVSADLEKRKAQYEELKTWKLTEDQKKAAIGYVLGTELETDKGGQTEYAKMLEATSLGLKVDQYLELRLQDISTDKFLENVKASKNADDAFELTIDISELEPMKGYKTVGEVQEWLVIAERPLPENYKIIQLEGKMDESEKEELRAVTDAGIRTYIYITFLYDTRGWESDRDANGKEIKSKWDKIVEYIHKLDLTATQKDALYLTKYNEKNLSKTPWHQ